MKILELRLKNLNSLCGEWHIDFTHPDYTSNGIFALTGPMGAGKSTILDAICLALYGATPRLGKITKNSNEIMTRHCGECYAEVVFESNTGRFRSHWQQRRARKSPKGKLQDQEHQIAEAESGKLLESKKSLVLGIIEEKTGMDFDRFTRSILLAQGGFDTFLKADSEQKSKILEQITGTEIYSTISRQVHERLREEKDKLKLLELETAGITLLNPQQEQSLQNQLTVQLGHERQISSLLSTTNQAITWLKNIEQIEKEIASLDQENEKLLLDINAFQPQQEKLEKALKASGLEGEFAALNAIRKQQQEEKTTLQRLQSQLPELEAALKEKTQQLHTADIHSQKSKLALKNALPLLQQVRSLDQQIEQQQKAIEGGQQHLAVETKQLAEKTQSLQSFLEKKASVQKSLYHTKIYLKDHASDEGLVSALPAIEQQIASLLIQQRELDQEGKLRKENEKALNSAKQELEENKKIISAKRKYLQQVDNKLTAGKQAVDKILAGRLLREYRTEKDSLLREMLLIRKIEELEEHREKLEDGKPCPLCGALEHPYAEGNIPAITKLEQRADDLDKLIAKIERQEEDLAKLQQLKAEAEKALHESKQKETILVNNQRSVEEKNKELESRIDRLNEEVAQYQYLLLIKLKPFNIDSFDIQQLESKQEKLKLRLKQWQQRIEELAQGEQHLVQIQNDITRHQALIESQQKVLEERQYQLDSLTSEHNSKTQQRKNLYGNKSPDEEEQRLYHAVNTAEQHEKALREEQQQNQHDCTSLSSRIDTLQMNIQQRAPELSQLQSEFHTMLTTAKFESEEAFKTARLGNEERENLSDKARYLEKRKTELATKLADRQSQRQQVLAKKLSGDELATLEKKREQEEYQLTQRREQVAELKQKLTQNQKAAELVQGKQQQINAQESECQRWDRLHQLIGSADGKKYRNFAQGLTFDLIINLANRQLRKMSDRYLLIHHQNQALELNVIDGYQAGETRSTRNLSGGESFIISLSLALGLSNMSSRKVRVDSLFLDEGFGSLDEESLDTALEVLAGMHQEGKLIGVISHINQLKERIPIQIKVEPLNEGKSRISGAGCRRV